MVAALTTVAMSGQELSTGHVAFLSRCRCASPQCGQQAFVHAAKGAIGHAQQHGFGRALARDHVDDGLDAVAHRGMDPARGDVGAELGHVEGDAWIKHTPGGANNTRAAPSNARARPTTSAVVSGTGARPMVFEFGA